MRNGFCCGLVPLLLLGLCGLGTLVLCHHGCHNGRSCRPSCQNVCRRFCRLCGAKYYINKLYRDREVCPDCVGSNLQNPKNYQPRADELYDEDECPGCYSGYSCRESGDCFPCDRKKDRIRRCDCR